MHQLLVFDLDGTLAALGEGILPENLNKLKKLEAQGYQIAVCSGKPTFYLCGFFRQAGLKQPILVGENGAVFQMGIELPPADYRVYPYAPEARKQIRRFRDILDARFPDLFYQPNEVVLTPFPKTAGEFEQIQKLIDREKDRLDALLIYRHVDCFDLIPKEINKKNGLTFLGELLNIPAARTIAIGDGINDLPMFAYADRSIGIGSNMPVEQTDYHFPVIGEALDFILEEDL